MFPQNDLDQMLSGFPDYFLKERPLNDPDLHRHPYFRVLV